MKDHPTVAVYVSGGLVQDVMGPEMYSVFDSDVLEDCTIDEIADYLLDYAETWDGIVPPEAAAILGDPANIADMEQESWLLTDFIEQFLIAPVDAHLTLKE